MSKLVLPLLRAMARYARFSSRRPWLALLVIGLLAAAALAAAAHGLRLDPRFDALLPSGTPSVVARREAKRRLGATDLYVIAVKSPDPLANYRFIRKLAARISKWPETEWALYRRDASVFRRSSLLFASEKDLARGAKLLARIIHRAEHRAKAKASGFIELDDEEQGKEEAVDKRDRNELKAIYRRYRASAKGERKGALFEKHPELRDALLSDRGDVGVVLAKLKGGTNDVAFARSVYLKGKALIQELGPRRYHKKMIARVAGAYRSFKEYDQALSDVRAASIASLVMVLSILILFFRRLRAVVVVMVPLLVGIAWSAGLAGLFFGTMNIITSFIAAILVGLGIDFSIHLYAAFTAARREGAGLEDGLAQAVLESGPGMTTAALTTMAALLTLELAHFRAFQEFGMLAAIGVLICLVAALLVLPPVVGALERIVPEKVRGPREDSVSRRRLTWLRWATRGGAAVAIAATALLTPQAPRIGFEYDFRKLRGKGVAKTGIAYGSAMRGSRASSPMAILGDSARHMRHAHKILVSRKRAEQACCDAYLAGKTPMGKWCRNMGLSDPRAIRMVYHGLTRRYCKNPQSPACVPRRVRVCKPRVQDIVTVATFIPDHQAEKLRAIRAIRRVLRPTKSTDPVLDAPKDIRGDLAELRKYAHVDRPLTVADLPFWARRLLTERVPGPDGKPRVGAVGFLYPWIHFRDVRDMMAMARDYATIRVDGRPIHLASSGFVVADVVATVQRDGARMFLYAGLAVLLLLLVDLLSLSGALLCFASLGVGFTWALGLMHLLDLKLGVYNMLVVPPVLGIGIDGSVHLYHRYLRLGQGYAKSPLGHTGGAVIASAVTTAAGFAGLFFIQHGGLRTIAQFATLGICLIIASILALLPGALMWLAGRRA